MTATGRLDLDGLRQLAAAGEIETLILGFTDLYGRLLGKRFEIDYALDEVLGHGTHACDYLLTVDMEMQPVPGYRFANWEAGYGDIRLAPDFATLCVADWLDKTALVLCDVVDAHDAPVAVAPRSILKRAVARAAQLGYRVEAASELEYYLFRDSFREAAAKGYAGLEPLGWYIEDYHLLQGVREEPLNAAFRRHLKRSGVPVESTKGEWGRGQHELNIRHADVLTMADRHVVLKQCLKETAERMGYGITFMAKPFADEAGSSSHLHLSLWAGEQNAFADAKGEPNDCFRWFLGGWMAHAAELTPFYAPTINAYKRFLAGSWAPTAVAWSRDNRTAGFRIVGHGAGLRIECRIPGADCNPYLAFAAALASGLDGIARRSEPPAEVAGDAYVRDLPRVPATLAQAVAGLEASAFARETFGAEVIEHLLHFYRTEQQAFDAAVTDWERQRYFERI
ncbi:MAG TPA: glutamine synthetase family protein [Limnochordia bacterium]|nr:glutamine synthetase family protein [Limnochordia bacterium]